MSNSISADGLRALFAEETGDIFLPLLTITHADLAAPIRVVADTIDMTYGANTYVGLPFELSLPPDTEDRVPEVSLTVDNVDQQIVQAVRTITSPPTVTLEIVRKDNGGVITSELGPMNFRMNSSNYDALKVSATLGYESDFLNEPATIHRFDPVTAPGVF